jgi:phosphate acyltransferase
VKRVSVALDAMGGDRAPQTPVAAALEAAVRLDIRIVLIGNEREIKAAIGGRTYPAHLIDIVDAPERVSMEDEAVAAVRRKRRASIPVGLALLKEGNVDVFLSAGNTGAIVASSVVGLGRLPGIVRPGIAVPLPTSAGLPMLLIDAGAIVDSKPEYLWQHARLAAAYSRAAYGVSSPTVGLVSNGEEVGKGNALTRTAFELLQADTEIDFVGNVETRDIASRPSDVLVTDGFTGNVVLKTAEGVVTLMQESLRSEFRSRWYSAILALLLKSAFRRAGKALDYREYGGAPLLGVNGLVMISHGSSDERALENAIERAVHAARQNTLIQLSSVAD